MRREVIATGLELALRESFDAPTLRLIALDGVRLEPAVRAPIADENSGHDRSFADGECRAFSFYAKERFQEIGRIRRVHLTDVAHLVEGLSCHLTPEEVGWLTCWVRPLSASDKGRRWISTRLLRGVRC